MKTSTIQNKMNQVVRNLPGTGYKMGDKITLTVTVNNEQLTATHDTRQWYSGRGSKFNKTVRHGAINKNMSLSELNKAYKPILQQIKAAKLREAEQKKYLKICNTPDFINQSIEKSIDIIAEKPAPEGDDRYYINGYHGCGAYRLAVQNGKIAATIHGGFHDSCPPGTNITTWIEAILAYLTAKLGENYKIIKADGSGCQFFLRNPEDEYILPTTTYAVPAANNTGNLGSIHINTQVAY